MKAFEADSCAGGGTGGSGRRSPAKTALCLAILLALPAATTAAQIDYEAGLGLLHSDNINLSEEDPVDEDVFLTALRFAARRDGSVIKLRSRGSLQYLNYLGDSFDNEVRGELAGKLDWMILPERMNWVFEDYLSRQPIDLLVGLVPSNQQQVNVFVTGPSFLARWSDATRAQIDLRYINSYAEETKEFNGSRVMIKAGLLRELNPTTSFSVNVEAATVEFNDAFLATDYKRFDGYLGLKRKLRALDLTADFGYTRLEPSGSSESLSVPLLRSELDWRISPRTVVSARVSYQFADAAQDLIRRGSELTRDRYIPIGEDSDPFDTGDGFGDAAVLVGADVYRERRVELGYQFSGERIGVRLRPYLSRVRYEAELNPAATDFNEDIRGQSMVIDYRLRPQLALSFTATHERRKFENLDRTDRDSGATLALANQSSTHWRWQIEIEHRRRNSSALGSSYTENAIIASIAYRR